MLEVSSEPQGHAMGELRRRYSIASRISSRVTIAKVVA
jgi:hypothetical protein